MLELNIQLFGGRGASSSKGKIQKTSKKAVAKAKEPEEESYYDNENVADYGSWWQDNVDNLVDRFEEKYKKPPVSKSGATHSKWDSFTYSEWEKENKKRK